MTPAKRADMREQIFPDFALRAHPGYVI